MSFKILVMSCDKNYDLWQPFYWCMEKYWSDHPEIIYSSETLVNPFYKTININYDIDKWTKRVYDTIKQIECDNVLLMVDDLFIREKVDSKFINSLDNFVGGIVGGLNFEKSFDITDIQLNEHLCIRNPNGKFKTSVMCQLWSKKAMLDIFNCEKNPWTFEKDNNSGIYLFLISRNKPFINWGYNERKWFGIRKGKWCKEIKSFFDNEGIDIDYSVRGFNE